MPTDSLKGRFVRVELLIGGVPQTFYYDENGKTFVAGRKDRKYTLRVTNLTDYNLEVVSSVDGRNTLEDEEADPVRNRGLVLPSFSHLTITGYRLDQNSTAPFVFGTPSESMAHEATGSSRNAGVVGFAVYREYVRRDTGHALGVSGPERYDGGQPRAKDISKSFSRGSDMGTKMGDEVQYDPVTSVHFLREDERRPNELLTFQYRSMNWLKREGIISADTDDSDEPQAFPGSSTGYARRKRQK